MARLPVHSLLHPYLRPRKGPAHNIGKCPKQTHEEAPVELNPRWETDKNRVWDTEVS